MAYNRTIVMRNEMPKPNSQPLDTGRVSTIELILSVTVAKVCPGSITGAPRSPLATSSVGPAIVS